MTDRTSIPTGRSLASLAVSAVLAVSGVFVAVQLNTATAPTTTVASETASRATPIDPVTAAATTQALAAPARAAAAAVPAPAATALPPGAGLLPEGVRQVLQQAAGAGSSAAQTLDAKSLSTHVPPAVAAVLAQRGAVLTIPPADPASEATTTTEMQP